MARILVTGAASFTGRHLRAALSPNEVLGLDLVSGPGVESVDVRDRGAMASYLAAHRPHAVIHLAGLTRGTEDACYAVNLDGTRNLVAAAQGAKEPPLLVVISSAAVYGKSRDEESPLPESTPPRPLGAYGCSKAAAELAALAAARRGAVPVVVVRPFNLVGPGLPPGFAPSDFVAQARAVREGEQAALRHGNLDPRRDFVDVRDAVRAYAALAQRPDLSGRVFNVATGVAVPVRRILELALAAGGDPVPTETDPERMRPAEVLEQAGHIGAISEAIGWEPRIALEQSIREMAETP